MNKKGLGTLGVVLIIALLAVGSLTAYGVISYQAKQTAAITAAAALAAIDYDGEFDDAYLATKSNFYSDFTEKTDCNVSSDVLGGSSFDSCIYNYTGILNGTHDSRDWKLDLVIDIDGDVEDMEVDMELQNTGTGQAADDFVIDSVKLYTYEDEPTLVMDLSLFIEDNNELDAETGVLEGDEYVLSIVLHSKTISPAFAAADDILRIELDLKTDGDADAARITLEN